MNNKAKVTNKSNWIISQLLNWHCQSRYTSSYICIFWDTYLFCFSPLFPSWKCVFHFSIIHYPLPGIQTYNGVWGGMEGGGIQAGDTQHELTRRSREPPAVWNPEDCKGGLFVLSSLLITFRDCWFPHSCLDHSKHIILVINIYLQL